MAYLITCAGSKITPSEPNPSSIEELSFNHELGNARNLLLELNPQIQLNWEFTLPAWQLYSGNRSVLYSHVAEHNWNKENVEIKILSALFGWVKHTDLLPFYNLQMSDKTELQNQRIYRFWHNQNLLGQLVNPADIELLSNNYRKAIHGNNNNAALNPNVVWNDKYGHHKGIWLNNQLEIQ